MLNDKEFQLALENFMSEVKGAEEGALTDVLSGTNKNVTELLQKMQDGLKNKLKTKKDCDEYIKVIDNEATEINTSIKTIQKHADELEKNKIDKKTFAEKVAPHIELLKEKCHALKVRLGSIVKDPENPTTEDLTMMKKFITGLKNSVLEIRSKLSNKVAKESSSETEFDDECEEDDKKECDEDESDDDDDDDEEEDDVVESALESLSEILNGPEPSFESLLDIFK